MKHYPSRTRPLGPHVLSGELYFQMPGGAAISCTCIADPYASIIGEMWKRETKPSGGIDFEAFRVLLLQAIDTGGGREKWAKANQLHHEYVADVIRRKREPSEALCAAVGMRRHVAYLPIEVRSE